MTMSATFYYRRNIDSVPDTIKRVMHKQAMLDAFPLSSLAYPASGLASSTLPSS